MARFYNPYHFVPVEKPGAPQNHLSIRRADRWPERVTHERYAPNTHSGRLVVRLTTVTPTVIGAKPIREDKGEYATIETYRVEGRPAIPASTLRGLIGSVIEAASGGPLRILDNSSYSYRRGMEESLSAIGLLVEDGGALKLQPMSLPTLESTDGGHTFEAPARFRRVFPKPQFKVFFGDGETIRSNAFKYRTQTNINQAVPMPVKQLAWSGNTVIRDRSLHVKANRFAVGQDADTAEHPRLGLVRVLGCWGDRKEHIPPGKRHELWIPLPDAAVKALPISDEAKARFEDLANECTDRDESLPYEPKDTRQYKDGCRAEKYLRPQAGDMVYFDVDSSGMQVTEISFSTIWRSRVEDPKSGRAAATHAFFEQIDGELLPFHSGRKTVSLPEQILGFAEQEKSKEEPANGSAEEVPVPAALASRLRFCEAQLPDGAVGLLDPPVTLKILASPKPPCPAFYFKSRTGRGAYITKRGLDPSQHIPQGRKWYLHVKLAPGERPWETKKPSENRNQKNIVSPISSGQQFFFHIDFDNLSEQDLGLLLYALEPDAKFHHKLGMGKPLGLGSVKVEVLGYFRVDRERRYTVAGLKGGRYSVAALAEPGKALLARNQWPDRYRAEAEAPTDPADILAAAREAVLSSGIISPSTQKALSLLGDYGAAPSAAEVCYPANADQHDKEAEHFKWFLFNDGHRERGRGMSPKQQFLKPLPSERSLPSLVELEWDAPSAPRR
jgi:CRISPR-associated protein (TIGR03986 family)